MPTVTLVVSKGLFCGLSLIPEPSFPRLVQKSKASLLVHVLRLEVFGENRDLEIQKRDLMIPCVVPLFSLLPHIVPTTSLLSVATRRARLTPEPVKAQSKS